MNNFLILALELLSKHVSRRLFFYLSQFIVSFFRTNRLGIILRNTTSWYNMICSVSGFNLFPIRNKTKIMSFLSSSFQFFRSYISYSIILFQLVGYSSVFSSDYWRKTDCGLVSCESFEHLRLYCYFCCWGCKCLVNCGIPGFLFNPLSSHFAKRFHFWFDKNAFVTYSNII